jgi:hypothetical protein
MPADQLGRLVHTALPGREPHRGIRNRQVAGRVRDQAAFVDQPLRCGQLASEQMIQAEEVPGSSTS